MTKLRLIGLIALLAGLSFAGYGSAVVADDGFLPLFPKDGVPAGWVVTQWNDLGKPASPGMVWTVSDGVLRSSPKRDNWLVSEREYGDFVLEFEIRLTELGNSGVALRAPLRDDPAFVAMEMQIADVRYNPEAKPFELTGALYRAAAPIKQAYKPTEWNSFRIELKGSRLKATLNGETIQDLDLDTLDQPTRRHDGSAASPVKDRPRRGHIGFQHLTRDSVPVLIRNARIKELK
jgi:Domain of Unknown Function (DUF1080)